MADRERKTLFAAAGLLVASAAMLLALLRPGQMIRGPAVERVDAGPPAPIVQAAGSEEPRPGDRRHPAPTPDERAAGEDRSVEPRPAAHKLTRAGTAARAFLSALLRRESGAVGTRMRRAIERRATARFAAFLLAGEPRPPAATGPPQRGRLLAIEGVGLGRGRAEFAATVERGRARSGLLVALVQREGTWRVAGLR
jgi:hypothetical protein